MAACDWEFLRQCNDAKTDESFVPSADERCATAEAIELNPWECDVRKDLATKRVSSPSFQQLIDVAGVKGAASGVQGRRVRAALPARAPDAVAGVCRKGPLMCPFARAHRVNRLEENSTVVLLRKI